MDKGQISRDFYEAFNKMKVKERDEFEKIANKLLSVCFITSKKESDRSDYYFIERFKPVFMSYFALIGWEVMVNARYGVVSLVNNENYNRFNLKLHESILLLILRLLFDEKMREVSESDQIVVTLEDIHEKYLALNLRDRIMNKTDLRAILSLFKRFNLLELIDKDLSRDDSRLFIYPSILFAVQIENISQIHDKIQTYQGGVSDEDSEED
jgi:hypothetical protein